MSRSVCQRDPTDDDDPELTHCLCPVIITALPLDGEEDYGYVWTNFEHEEGVSWGYQGPEELEAISQARRDARPVQLREAARQASSNVHSNDPHEKHRALYQGTLDYYTSIGAPQSMTDPQTVLHFESDVRTINAIRDAQNFPYLPIPALIVGGRQSTNNALPDAPGETPSTEFDPEIAAGLQAAIDSANTLQRRLERHGVWPLIRLPRAESRRYSDTEEGRTEHPYENTSLEDPHDLAWLETDESSSRPAIEVGIENRILQITGGHVRIRAPHWCDRDTSDHDWRGVNFRR